uniref:Uncharacterized protein n=1 Tax=Triticum urartu TaxID=4572 RepID=A0A8R7PBF9_TRIUA
MRPHAVSKLVRNSQKRSLGSWDTVMGAECPWPSQHIRDAHIITVINANFHGQAHAMFS